MKETTSALCLRETDRLLHPFLHRKIHIRTRLVMPSMCFRAVPREELVRERMRAYTHIAARQIGLIVTDPIAVNDESAREDDLTPGLNDAAGWRDWRRICRAVQASDCRIAAQLCHAGMLCRSGKAAGPSGIDPVSLEHLGESMSRDRIHEVARAFGEAAGIARRIGFDAVEIQGGQGGLIEQFLNPATNKREDEYGGDAVSRTRFACEVLHAVRKAVGRYFPIIFRLSFRSRTEGVAETLAELESFLRHFCDAGVDIFACSGQGAHEPAFHGAPLSVAGWIRLLTQRPVITDIGADTSSLRLMQINRALRAGEFDLVALVHTMAADTI